jgi:hypothetical protein
MRRRRFILVGHTTLSLLLAAVTGSAAEWRYGRDDNGIQQATVEASGRGPGTTVEANFRLFCSPGKKGGLFLEGEVSDADSITGFNFADFEGPDAPFGENRLATLTLRSAGGPVTVRSSGAGWYSDANRFKFSVGLDHLSAGEKAKVRKALRGDMRAVGLSLHELKNPQNSLTISAEGEWKSDAVGRVVAGCEHP